MAPSHALDPLLICLVKLLNLDQLQKEKQSNVPYFTSSVVIRPTHINKHRIFLILFQPFRTCFLV